MSRKSKRQTAMKQIGRKTAGAGYIEHQFDQFNATDKDYTDVPFEVEVNTDDYGDTALQDLVFEVQCPVTSFNLFKESCPTVYPKAGAFKVYRMQGNQLMIYGWKSEAALHKWEKVFDPPRGAVQDH